MQHQTKLTLLVVLLVVAMLVTFGSMGALAESELTTLSLDNPTGQPIPITGIEIA